MTRFTPRRLFAAMLLLAICLRAAASWPLSLHHPDEYFQYLEPGYRLLHGFGITTWEYRYGMRSWLVPLLTVPFMALGQAIAPASLLYAKLPVILSGIASLAIIWSFWRLGLRRSDTTGLISAFVGTIWFEQIYFSAHLLTEVLATGCILPAAVLLTASDRSFRHLLSGGALLALGGILRFQYGPAIATLALLCCAPNIRRSWWPVALGVLMIVAISCAIDLAMGQIPLGWKVENVRQNIIANRAAYYGVDGPLAYLAMLASYWHLAMLPLFLLAVPAIRTNQPLFWAALVNLGIHMLIGHKEYRFIFLSTTILTALAAIGSAELVARLQTHLAFRSRLRAILPIVLIACWIATSGALAMSKPMIYRWTAYSPAMQLAHAAGEMRQICGLALPKKTFWRGGGYTYLNRHISLYLTDWSHGITMSPQDFRQSAPAFNALIGPANDPWSQSNGYRPIQCAGSGNADGASPRLCLSVRPGTCQISAGRQWEIQALMLRTDE